jgi:hypothetical protein
MGKALSRLYGSFMFVLKLTKLTNNSKILKQKDFGVICQFQYKNDAGIFRSPFIQLCSGNYYPSEEGQTSHTKDTVGAASVRHRAQEEGENGLIHLLEHKDETHSQPRLVK